MYCEPPSFFAILYLALSLCLRSYKLSDIEVQHPQLRSLLGIELLRCSPIFCPRYTQYTTAVSTRDSYGKYVPFLLKTHKYHITLWSKKCWAESWNHTDEGFPPTYSLLSKETGYVYFNCVYTFGTPFELSGHRIGAVYYYLVHRIYLFKTWRRALVVNKPGCVRVFCRVRQRSTRFYPVFYSTETFDHPR